MLKMVHSFLLGAFVSKSTSYKAGPLNLQGRWWRKKSYSAEGKCQNSTSVNTKEGRG